MKDGSRVRSIQELCDKLSAMDDTIFAQYVIGGNNMFATWIGSLGEKDLAAAIRNEASRAGMILSIEHRLRGSDALEPPKMHSNIMHSHDLPTTPGITSQAAEHLPEHDDFLDEDSPNELSEALLEDPIPQGRTFSSQTSPPSSPSKSEFERISEAIDQELIPPSHLEERQEPMDVPGPITAPIKPAVSPSL